MDTNRRASRNASRPALRRDASGRLQPDSGDNDIGDVWAHQRRLSLKESIAEDRRRAARERIRRERGLVGLASVELHILVRRLRLLLFGTRSLAPVEASNRQPTPKQSAAPPQTVGKHNRHSQPSQKTSKPGGRARAFQPLAAFPAVAWRASRRLPRRLAAGLLAAVVVGAIIIVISAIHHHGSGQAAASGNGAPAASDIKQPGKLQKGNPDYRTLLPAGKNINQLGGWTRVSPPGRNPVYAYTDRIGNTAIAVSQQPLPANFKQDPAGSISQLAKAYSATQKLSAKGTDVYIGTSAKGPQSVIFTSGGLLILIKSEAPIPADQWTSYIASLQ